MPLHILMMWLFSETWEEHLQHLMAVLEEARSVVLSQLWDEGEHPVAYISRKLQPQEQGYTTIQKECLAMK